MSEKDQAFISYLKNRKALIVEPSSTFSAVLGRSLEQIGLDSSAITVTSHFTEAKEKVDDGVDIIISEYHLKGGFGLELANLQKKKQRNFTERIFIITTGNATESAVAEAAEEDVDGYILKPFSPEQFEQSFRKVLASKLSPSEYWKCLQQGQEYFDVGETLKALKSFEEAEEHSEAPSLACYYQGHTHSVEKEIEKALVDFQRGLNINPIHYKCLQGQFEILFKLEKRTKAYEVAKTIKSHFPITPQRLANFFLLAVYTHNFEDLTDYFETFEQYEHRSDELSRLVSAGMLAAGKYAKKSGDDELAFDYLKKSQWAMPRDLDLLEKLIKYFAELECYEEAEFFVKKIPSEHVGSGFQLRMEFMVQGHLYQLNEKIKRGQKIIELGDVDVDFFNQLIQMMVAEKKNVVAEEFIGRAIAMFPHRRKHFNALLDD